MYHSIWELWNLLQQFLISVEKNAVLNQLESYKMQI